MVSVHIATYMQKNSNTEAEERSNFLILCSETSGGEVILVQVGRKLRGMLQNF